MKYVLDLFKIIIFVAIMYLPLSWLSRKESIRTLDKINETSALTKLTAVKNTTQLILEKNDILEACQRLDAEILAGNISTYTVIGPESSCYKPEGMSALPPNLENNVPTSFLVKDIPLTFIKYSTPPYQWAISVLTPQKINIYSELKNNKALREELVKDFILVIYNVFAFILCAVLIFAESIQNRYKKNGKDPVWLNILSRIFGFLQLNDMKIIKSATKALIKKNEDLTKDIDLLQTSLEYSILNEIKRNNQSLPYSFYGTVAKVDINGFSKVVSAKESGVVQQMTLRLEDFGCELLQRYSGLFEKTIGDEIVVVFKGHNSELNAAAFSRDLMTEFSNQKFLIGQENRQFTLKSAIYSSEIIFSKRVSGYGFSGDALTFTTRLLDAVNIKDRNILSLVEIQSSNSDSIAKIPALPQKFEFKNMLPQNGYLIDQFNQINFLNLNTDLSSQKLISYLKSDSHILSFFDQLFVPKNEHTDLILNTLLNINVRVGNTEILKKWIQFINQINLDKSNISASQVAKSIMLAANLIPKSIWTEQATDTLLKIPRNIEGRINASIIEILIIHDISSLKNIDSESFKIKNDISGRTQSNILVFKAISQLENYIFNDFINMIKSENLNISKSGIYGACQIIEYYKLHNPAGLETFSSYSILHNLLTGIKHSKKIKLSDRLQERINKI